MEGRKAESRRDMTKRVQPWKGRGRKEEIKKGRKERREGVKEARKGEERRREGKKEGEKKGRMHLCLWGEGFYQRQMAAVTYHLEGRKGGRTEGRKDGKKDRRKE